VCNHRPLLADDRDFRPLAAGITANHSHCAVVGPTDHLCPMAAAFGADRRWGGNCQERGVIMNHIVI
jgi:hypothetical protein